MLIKGIVYIYFLGNPFSSMQNLSIKQYLAITFVVIWVSFVSMVIVIIGSIHSEHYAIAKLEQITSINTQVIQVSAPQSGGSNTGTSSGVKGVVFFEGLPCPPSGNNKTPPGCRGPASNYEVVIYAEDGSSIVTRTRTDDRGNYFISLPPGSYVIYTPAGPLPSMRMANHFLIRENQIFTKDLVVDTGIR
jgi:hypothetical protein